jgi:MYXO-CTERM domain-containing protein
VGSSASSGGSGLGSGSGAAASSGGSGGNPLEAPDASDAQTGSNANSTGGGCSLAPAGTASLGWLAVGVVALRRRRRSR